MAKTKSDTAKAADPSRQDLTPPASPPDKGGKAAQGPHGPQETPEASVPAPEPENAATGGVGPDAAKTEDYPVEILLQVVHPTGIYMRMGPGKGFEPVQTLPRGTMITRMSVPEYAEVPGWLCVSLEGPHGQPIYGWVDATLVEEI